MSAEKPIDRLFHDFWAWRLWRTPEFATLAGRTEYNNALEDYSLKRFEDDYKSSVDFLARSKDISPEESLSGQEKLNLRFLQAELETFASGFKFKGFLFPISYLEGVHIDFERLSEWMTLKTEKDFQDLVERYEKFPAQAQGIVEILEKAVKEQMVFHAISMKGVIDSFKKHTSPPAKETVFWDPFRVHSVNGIPQDRFMAIQERAELAIRDMVQPGMKQIESFVENSYQTRPEIAATSLPNGVEFYNQCIKFHTSTKMTPQEIHEIGLKEVERIESEMKKIAVEITKDPNVTLKAFMNILRDDPAMFYQSKEEVLQDFREIVTTKITPRLTTIFKEKPKLDIEVVMAPQPESPAAYYISGTPDGARPGKFFVNGHKYASQPKYDMMTLALHESNPGHHLQGAYLLTTPGIPEFRTIMEDRSYFMAPSRFPINTAYGEGWGLYSESLGFDLKLYDDPLDRFGHHSAEVFRACRLVVDTGIHAFGWSRQRAVDYMMEHSASSLGHTEAEIDRYITWPGQALGYKIGEIKIQELRKRAEAALGSQFDLKQFHEVALRSAGPLEVLEEEVDKYIRTPSA